MKKVLGVLTALVTGGAAAAVLGCLEPLVLHEFRGIVTGILGTAALAVGVGWSTGWGARLWHLRNRPVVAWLGLLCGLLAEIVTFWVLAHLLAFGEEGRTVPVVVPLGELSPGEVLDVLGRAIDEGAWHWTRHWHFRGVALILVWIVEAIFVVGGSAIFALVAVEARPYCERCESWLRGPKRVGPLSLPQLATRFDDSDPVDPTDEDELEFDLLPIEWTEEELRRLEPESAPGRPCYLVDLWQCQCQDRALASVLLSVPGSDPRPLVERRPICRQTRELLLQRELQQPIAGQTVLSQDTQDLPHASVPGPDSRWVRPCSSCGRRLATGFWDHLNGFTVVCPFCSRAHSHHGNTVILLTITAFTGPLAFFLTMRPLRALRAFLLVAAVIFLGYRWFATHPSLGLESAFYVVLLLGCVVINAFALTRQKA